MNRVDIDTYKQLKKTPIQLVLDNIRSANNVGSIFRSADAFAIEAIHLCGITAKPPHRDILKTAIGATKSVEWSYHSTTQEAVDILRAKNYMIASLEQVEQSTALHQFQIGNQSQIALVVGNEVSGVDQKIIDLSDLCLEIPQFGTKHSLNVSVSLGIALWELSTKLNDHFK